MTRWADGSPGRPLSLHERESVLDVLARLEREGFADSQSPQARKRLWRFRVGRVRFEGPRKKF